jgi:hypothetical protein
MTYDDEYRLSARDARRMLHLVGQLKEAIAELLSHRHVILTLEEFDDIPTASEVHFYEKAEDILSNMDF